MEKKYSDWLKLDLHIHTDLSKTTKQGDYKGCFSVEVARDKLKNNDVKIFSFTDHNIVNVPAYEEYYSTTSPEDPFLLLGVEFDIVVSRKKGRKNKTYHTLIIFNISDIEGVKSINEKIEAKYIEKGIVNKKERLLTIDDIVEMFPRQDYFFIPHAYSEKNILTAHRDGKIKDAQKMVLLMPCALEKVTKQETIESYNIGFNTLLASSFKSKEDIPYINFSDNHCISNYPCRHKGENNIGNHEFYYIKGSKCYESIRLAFIDPGSRIKTTGEFEAINHTNNTIDQIKISGSAIIDDVLLEFSPHLNVIIGGRSSGKSLLMWILGKKLDSLDLENKYKKIELDYIQIKSKQDANFTSSTSLQQHYIYINQGDIINYFESGELKDLAKKSSKLEEYDMAIGEFKKHKQKLEIVKSEFISSYQKAYELGSSSKYVLHDVTIVSILSSHYILKFKDKDLITRFDISESIDESRELLDRINSDINLLSSNDLLDLSGENNIIIKSFIKLIKEKSDLINKKKKKNLQKVSFIKSVNPIIDKINSGLDQEARLKEKSNQLLVKFQDDIKNKFIALSKLKSKSLNLETFNCDFRQEINIVDGIDLVLETAKTFNIKDELLDAVLKPCKELSSYVNMLSLLRQTSSIKNFGGNLPANLSKKVDSNLKTCLSELTNPKDYLLYEDDESSKEKSPGYNSEKYLQIILKNSLSKTIFIDQPEDNLGNRFIAKELVGIIRNIKFQKQVFLVTHNPSIVVYGDAESIILASNTDNKISYQQIVLEDRNAQKEICEILDGGEYIFNNRSRKYNIQRILKEA